VGYTILNLELNLSSCDPKGYNINIAEYWLTQTSDY